MERLKRIQGEFSENGRAFREWIESNLAEIELRVVKRGDCDLFFDCLKR